MTHRWFCLRWSPLNSNGPENAPLSRRQTHFFREKSEGFLFKTLPVLCLLQTDQPTDGQTDRPGRREDSPHFQKVAIFWMSVDFTLQLVAAYSIVYMFNGNKEPD